MNDRGLPANSVASIRLYLQALLGEFEEREREQIISQLFHHVLGWGRAELILRLHERLSESEILALHKLAKKIKSGTPVQYALGRAVFYGREFKVNPEVLIPRPETEELVHLVLDRAGAEAAQILDVGTGSGCIAITLKLERPGWHIDAVDVSPGAIDLAHRNASARSAEISFHQLDILNSVPMGSWDMIVSNPPYIARAEAAQMHPNVTEHEPHLALFVPDSDPLVFYRRIAEIGIRSLKPGGFVAVECNERLSHETAGAFSKGYRDVEVVRDLQDKPRMVFARIDRS